MDNSFKIRAGKVFKSIRNKNKLSQKNVASMLGKDQSQISRIERGLEDIRFSEVDKFCKHCNVSLLDLVAKIKCRTGQWY